MLMFIEKVDGSIIHNVGAMIKFTYDTFMVTIINGFGQKDSEIKVEVKDILSVSTYEYNKLK